MPAVPALWRAWHEAAAIPPNVQLAISAGASLPLELEAAVFERSGLKLHNFYGSSECGGIAYDRSGSPRRDPTLAGEPLEGVALAIAEDGCLVVRSRAVGRGFQGEADARLQGGCFHTRDLAGLIDGRVFLRGRLSDVINVAGRKLSPESVEAALRRQQGIRDCVVVGVPAPDASRGEEVLAIVCLAEGASVEAVRTNLSRDLTAWQRPRHWWAVPEINVNQRGKISRREWRERFLASRPIPSYPSRSS